MLIRNVHPNTLGILARQRCVILTASGGVLTTIPVERILSFNKNTMIIDNADHTIVRQDSYFYGAGTDFIGACILRIEPAGNIFVAEARINEDIIQQAVDPRHQQSDFGPNASIPPRSHDTELVEAIRMAMIELNNRSMTPNGPSRMSSISMLPPQMQSQMVSNPAMSKVLQNDPNLPVQHKVPFSVPVYNTPPRYVVQQKDQFSRPAAFGPSQFRSNPLGQSPTWLHCDTPPELAPMMAHIQYHFGPMASALGQAAHQSTIQKVEDEEDLYHDPKTRISEQALRQNAKEPETIEVEAQYMPTDSCKNARMETANHISGMINAILSSGNTRGTLPINDGPVAAFVNGDGDVILSYSDGSISPAIRPEAVGVDEDQIDIELQGPIERFPIPIKELNPASQL